MPELILFNKPFGVLCQFRAVPGTQTLADFIERPGFYPAGRLDKDSEGLVILTDDGKLQARIADPRHKLAKTYWVQVEGLIDDPAIARLTEGIMLKDGPTRRAEVRRIAAPLPPRTPPIRVRSQIPTSWIEVRMREGRNRQVRRMTAAVGFPTLRLYRCAIGHWTTTDLVPGEWCQVSVAEAQGFTSARRR